MSYLNELLTSGDFLTLSRNHPHSLAPTQFTIQHRDSQTDIAVSVIDTGIICFEPKGLQGHRDIVLSCGVHGNETAPIEICAELVQNLLLGKQPLIHRVLFLFGNIPAMNIGERFVEENMNRLFSGAHAKGEVVNEERRRAAQLEQAVAAFFQAGSELDASRVRHHYDLHTAIRAAKYDKFAVYPFRHGKPWQKSELQFLLACGVNTILLSHSPTTTFSYFSSNEFGAHAFTVELGKVKPFGENNAADFAATRETLAKFIAESELSLKVYDSADFHIFEIYQTINRTQQDFRLNFADDVPNFTDFPVDSVLAYDGERQITVKRAGEAIIFPNASVAIGQRALLTVTPTSIE